MTKKEKEVLLYFLKAGYSTRQLDKIKLGLDPNLTKGYSSWEILKKYKLRDEDKHKLFIYNKKQSDNIILKLSELNKKGAIDILIASNKPTNIDKYCNSYLLAESEDSLEKIMSGETRNITRNFFLSQKKIIRECQYKNCKAQKLETCHFKRSRPEIFKKSASKFKKDLNGLFLFDLYRIFEDYLYSHKEKKSVCFLCKYHHQELDRLERKSKVKLREYAKDIEWIMN
tara:strand:+ start:657 stop:1340 length:684 start_codon:yes stop_codon:yes gene_type:complete